MSKRRHNCSTDSKRYYDWLERAGEDIISAGMLIQNDSCYNAAAFHCQQATEKAIKAYILLKSGEVPDGHNLPWLCKRAMRYDTIFSDWLAQSSSLNRCYIETRYPADLPQQLDFGRVMNYYRAAKGVYLFICGEVDKILEKNNLHPSQRD